MPATTSTTVRDIAPPPVARAVVQRIPLQQLHADGVARVSALRQALQSAHQTVTQAYAKTRNKHTRELSDVNVESAKKIKEPSKTRYFLFGLLCVVADTAGAALISGGFALTEVFGIGIILGIAATLFVTIVMWIGSRVLLGKYAKQVQEHRDELQERGKDLSRDVQIVRQEYNNLLTWIGNAKNQFPQLAEQGGALLVKAGALAKKTNLIKYSGKAAIFVNESKWLKWLRNPIFTRISESIPLWNIMPWWTIGAFATYISHRADWREAQGVLQSYSTGKQEVVGLTDSLYKTRLAVISQSYAQS